MAIFLFPRASCKAQFNSTIKRRIRILCKLQWHSRTFACWQFVEISDRRRCEDDSIQRQLGRTRKLKRIHIRNLWIQDLVREKIIRLCRVPTAINPSDLNTKKLSQERRKKLMALIPIGFQTGMEIEIIETEKTLDSSSLQKILRVLQVVSTPS